MTKKIKNVKLLLYLCLAMFLLNSCTEEKEFIENNPAPNQNLKTYFISGLPAKKVADKLIKELKVTSNKKNSLESSFSTTNGTVIDYSNIMVVENEFNNKTYSLKVDSPTESATVFQNLIMIEKQNQTVTKLVTYQMTPAFAAQYRADLKPIDQFEGSVSITTLEGEDCCNDPNLNISIGGGGGDVSDDGGGSQTFSGGSSTNSGGWGISIINGGGNYTSEETDDWIEVSQTPRYWRLSNNISNSETSDPNTNSPADLIDLCCIYDIGLYEEAMFKNDCDKLKKATQENANMITELTNLATKTAEPIEYGKYKLSGSTDLPSATNAVDGSLLFPVPATGKYEVMAHTHNSPANSTYSIFSWEDIATIDVMIRANKINTSKFVSFLMTADGTSYAFTITDVTKFKKVFSTTFDGNSFDILAATEREIAREKYYYGDPETIEEEEIIKASNTDNNADEIAFVQMLEKMDCGITLFEVDETFTNFEKISLNATGTIAKQPCNN